MQFDLLVRCLTFHLLEPAHMYPNQLTCMTNKDYKSFLANYFATLRHCWSFEKKIVPQFCIFLLHFFWFVSSKLSKFIENIQLQYMPFLFHKEQKYVNQQSGWNGCLTTERRKFSVKIDGNSGFLTKSDKLV